SGRAPSAGTEAQSVALDSHTRAEPDAAISGQPLLSVQNLSVAYTHQRRWWQRGALPASNVKDVSFDRQAGQTLALLGDSGCGKTTTAKALLRLLDKTALVDGKAYLNGTSLLDARGRRLLQLRQSI